MNLLESSEWEKLFGEITPPETAKFAQVYVFLKNRNHDLNSGAWIDDIVLTKQSNITPTYTHKERVIAENFLINSNLNTTTGWYSKRSEMFQSGISRTNDGSGAYKLTKPLSQSPHDWVVSRTYIVEPNELYSFSAYMKSESQVPGVAGMHVTFRDENVQFLENSQTALQSNSQVNMWEEVTSQITVPQSAKYAQVYFYLNHTENPEEDAILVDDFYMSKGVSYENAPSDKKSFLGEHTQIDALGNVKVKDENGEYQPFFPLCIFADNNRSDWSVYSTQGFNCNMWAGSHLYVQKAKDAVSAFNPNGMMSGFQIANYIEPTHHNYNDTVLLGQRIDEIESAGLNTSLLFYYLDNENAGVREWAVPNAVSNTIKQKTQGILFICFKAMRALLVNTVI